MTTQVEPVQGTLLPPEAVTATLRVGIVGAGDHLQVLLEVRSATDGTLLAMEALSHAPISQLSARVDEWAQRLVRAVRPHVLPF